MKNPCFSRNLSSYVLDEWCPGEALKPCAVVHR